MVEKIIIWNEFIDLILIACYITKYVTIKVILFLLIYDKKVILLIDKPYNLSIRDCMI